MLCSIIDEKEPKERDFNGAPAFVTNSILPLSQEWFRHGAADTKSLPEDLCRETAGLCPATPMTGRRASAGKGRSPKPSGRRPGPSRTREQILKAARESFARRGYDATSLRGVAAQAGVDPALVRRFYGSKEGLLVAALTATFRPSEEVAEVVSGDLDMLGDQILSYTLRIWEQAPSRDMLVGMIRSACTNERAATLLRDFFASQILARIAGALKDKEAELRASAIGSQIVGLAFYRYVLKVEPIASASPETLRAMFGPTLQGYLTGPLNLPRAKRRK
jgi:AcrR family transcriptional regulator